MHVLFIIFSLIDFIIILCRGCIYLLSNRGPLVPSMSGTVEWILARPDIVLKFLFLVE